MDCILLQGILPSKNVVAVKKLYVGKSKQGMDDFLNEMVLISGMKHRNLVKLKGCCLREKERLLVYEYVDNHDLDWVLLGKKILAQHALETGQYCLNL